jgi:hypothetical protein
VKHYFEKWRNKMKAIILIVCILIADPAFSAETAKNPVKAVKKESAAKKSTDVKQLKIPEMFAVNDKICYKYNPNNTAYFEMTVKSVTDKEIVISSVMKGGKEVKEPHEEKYTPAELKDFLGKVKLIPCK